MKRTYLGLSLLVVVTSLMTSCSVEVKPLDDIRGKDSASETSKQSTADTADEQSGDDEQRSPVNEQSDGTNVATEEAAAEKKCASGDATSDIMCDVENM